MSTAQAPRQIINNLPFDWRGLEEGRLIAAAYTMESSESGPSSAPILFKRKTKSRGGSASATAAAPASTRSQITHDDDDEDAPIAVVRTKGLRGRAAPNAVASSSSSSSTRRDARASATQPQPSTSSLSFAEDHASFNEEPPRQASSSGRSMLKAPISQPSRLARPGDLDAKDPTEVAPSTSGSRYDAAALAELKAATPNRQGRDVEPHDIGSQAFTNISDPDMQLEDPGESLVRRKYDADFAHNAIPSEAVIAAAKEKRRRGQASAAGDSDDFIALSDTREVSRNVREPHPESRLQREEDEEGSGEEEFAAFTGAQERVALGRNARDAAKREHRMQIQEAMEVDGDANASDASDDSAREWEAAQMQRMHISSKDERKQRSKREASPYRPAPIPRTAPLPQLGATSIRLRARLHELQETATSHEAIVKDAEKQLTQLLDDEKRNKTDTESTAEKESWFRELQDFILSVARFLESKVPLVQALEGDWNTVLRERTLARREARSLVLEDDFALFHGVPSVHLLANSRSADAQTERRPLQDGDALSQIRTERRQMPTVDALSDDALAASSDSFYVAQDDLRKQVEALMSDVQAPEFQDPAARITREDGTRSLHPASLVARFHRWRRLYPDEYGNAWGGLTLAGVWDFWMRRELCAFDFLTLPAAFSFDAFNWFIELTHYAERSQQHHQALTNGHGKESADADMAVEHIEPIGGDDEIVAHAFTSTFLPLFTRQIEEGALDVWSASQTRSALEVAEQVSYVLEKDTAAFQSLVGAVLATFKAEVDVLARALAMPPALPPPMTSQARGLVAVALKRTLHGLTSQLFRNLISWHRFVGPAQRPQLVDLATTLTGRAIVPLLERLATEARHLVSAPEHILSDFTSVPDDLNAFIAATASDILQRCARPAVLRDDVVRMRLSAMAGQPPPPQM